MLARFKVGKIISSQFRLICASFVRVSSMDAMVKEYPVFHKDESIVDNFFGTKVSTVNRVTYFAYN